MTPEEYAAAQAAISAVVANYVAKFGSFFVNPVLSVAEWIGLLQLLFPEVERARFDAAELARNFYDSQRAQFLPTAPRHDVFLERYDFPSFVKALEPVRPRLSMPQAPRDAVTSLVLHSVREVENAGRFQIINSIEADEAPLEPAPVLKPVTDPIRARIERKIAEEAGRQAFNQSGPVKVEATGPVRGWARVATGKETCAWCLMLISRGPVYKSSKSAGLDLHDAGASDMIAAGEDVSEYMTEWHIGCDCKVVPVYDKANWFGQQAAYRAGELWIDASLEARSVLEADPEKKYYSFKERRWKPTTLNREAINALRRRLERGDISMSEFTALAA